MFACMSIFMYGLMDPARKVNVIIASDKAIKMEVPGRRPDYSVSTLGMR